MLNSVLDLLIEGSVTLVTLLVFLLERNVMDDTGSNRTRNVVIATLITAVVGGVFLFSGCQLVSRIAMGIENEFNQPPAPEQLTDEDVERLKSQFGVGKQ